MPITFTKIQAEILEAYKSTSRIAAQLAAGDTGDMSRALEIMATQFERGVIALRQYCEENTAPRGSSAALSPPPIRLAGRATVNEYGWLHIELNTLLPHCRVTSPQYLTDTITRLLDEYVCGGRTLPRFDAALLVIDEHCNIDSRKIYDQDNKGWKAIPNALKGRVISDDDQFTLGVCMLSTRSRDTRCHIWLLPPECAGDFFCLRSESYLLGR